MNPSKRMKGHLKIQRHTAGFLLQKLELLFCRQWETTVARAFLPFLSSSFWGEVRIGVGFLCVVEYTV